MAEVRMKFKGGPRDGVLKVSLFAVAPRVIDCPKEAAMAGMAGTYRLVKTEHGLSYYQWVNTRASR